MFRSTALILAISFLDERENEGTVSVFIADIQLRRLASQGHIISSIPARTR